MAPKFPRALEIEGLAFATLTGRTDADSPRPAMNDQRRSQASPYRTAQNSPQRVTPRGEGRKNEAKGIVPRRSCPRPHATRPGELTPARQRLAAVRCLITAIAFLTITSASAVADDLTIDGGIGLWALAVLPADHPEGTNAAVKVVSLKRAPNVHDPLVSTFIVDYRPGGSAVLHRKPSAGYVLVYVLSGSIQAQAWSADVGVYRTGQTWVYPAFADNITSKNASTTEPARALVILVASDTDGSGPK